MLPFRTSYVTSHVGPHPMHRALVRGVDADVGRVDYWLRSIDVPRPRWQQYLSWLMNGWASPYRRDYDLFVLEGFQIPPMLMKWMRRIDSDQKVICHHTAEQLYFLQTGFYSKKTDWLMRRVIRDYDAHICVGDEQTRLLGEVLDGHPAHVYNVRCTHIGADKYERFSAVTPALDGKRILFVGNIYGTWRVHYKGLDLLLDAFARAVALDPELSLTVIGTKWEDFRPLLKDLDAAARARIELVPFAEDLSPQFARHALLLLPARGDAFPPSCWRRSPPVCRRCCRRRPATRKWRPRSRRSWWCRSTPPSWPDESVGTSPFRPRRAVRSRRVGARWRRNLPRRRACSGFAMR